MKKVADFLGIISWVVAMIVVISQFSQLPEEVPSHYNFKGEVDSWADKSFIFFLPSIGIALWLFMLLFEKRPKFINMPNFKADASEEQRVNMSRMANVVKNELLIFMSWMTVQSVYISINGATSTGMWDIAVFIIVLFGTITYYSLKNKKILSEIKVK